MKDKILALLQAKFAGVRKDGLTYIAATIAMAAKTDEEAKVIVDKLTADDVNQFVTDWRKDADTEISKAIATNEQTLREKYDFKEKGKPAPQDEPDPNKKDDLAAIVAKAVKDATEPILADLNRIKGGELANTRKAELEKLFTNELPESYKKTILEGFNHRNFKDDADFNEYLNQTRQNVDSFKQEIADSGLAGHTKPVFGKTNENGVSQATEAYIANKQAEAKGEGLSGKQI